MDYSRNLYIVDASVIIKWFMIEDLREKALRLKKDFLNEKIELGIPTLALYEVMNYLGRNHQSKCLLFFSQLLMLKITEYPITLEDTSKAIEIIQKTPRTSFYDSTYHATAINNHGIFITADEKYYQKAKALKHIKLLRDYR